MKAVKYVWSRRFGIPAQVFGEIYHGLKRRSPAELLRVARAKRSPLHRLFEWDNRRAGDEYRLMQARIMVNSLQVEITSVQGKTSNVIAFIRSSDLGRHVPTMEASREEVSDEMQRCWRDMLRFRAKYKSLEVASTVVAAIEDVDRRMRRARRRAA